ncbi:MAG: CDP-diacylglycerol--glycerol-3-phosphate 3-phosphatidyltransferase [Spirochaetales bacterium]|jgi:CDP-diacylglycerol--glycerol-3-phosphate 3-phosphatidyltransferase|nr:CDP-diacylglycerol--glycerol-3-phosphate 3-phosphatidyltransferase [Spirochaetales bacterium]
MNLPTKITVSRIIASPVFFVLYFLPGWAGMKSFWLVPAIWLLYLYAEVSDVLDGWLARRRGLVTDLGKILDPFSDVISRMTFFYCFTLSGFMPKPILLILLYREFGILFVRMFMMGRGKAMGASIWGKLKAVCYFFSAVLGLLTMSGRYLGGEFFSSPPWNALILGFFILSAVSSVASFFTYLVFVKRSLSNP